MKNVIQTSDGHIDFLHNKMPLNADILDLKIEHLKQLVSSEQDRVSLATDLGD